MKLRKGDMDRIDTVVEILAETPFAHQRFQVHVGGADQADIHRSGLSAADPDDAAALDGTQQFGLQMQGDVAYFVKE